MNRTATDVLWDLYRGRMSWENLDMYSGRADSGLQVRYDGTDEDERVYVQLKPFAAQAYTTDTDGREMLADFGWDELQAVGGDTTQILRSDVHSFITSRQYYHR
jgi:hypothetical protein